jgi:hypothetical protein
MQETIHLQSKVFTSKVMPICSGSFSEKLPEASEPAILLIGRIYPMMLHTYSVNHASTYGCCIYEIMNVYSAAR